MSIQKQNVFRAALGALPCLVLTACGVALDSSGDVAGGAYPSPRGTRAVCGPDDRPETGLQGEVPIALRTAPNVFEGFWCNVRLVGQQTNLDRGQNHQVAYYDHCVYEGMRSSSDTASELSGVAVIDIKDPTNPELVKIIRTPGTFKTVESLHTAGGVMVVSSGPTAQPLFEVWDISKDCREPVLLWTQALPIPNHGAVLAADGKTWYGLNLAGGAGVLDMEVYDLANPAMPRLMTLGSRTLLPADLSVRPGSTGSHDGDINPEGTRLYLANTGNGLTILDTTEIQERSAIPQARFVSNLAWTDSAISHTAYHVHFNGKPYILSSDEAGTCQDDEIYTRTIDISDEKNPTVVSTFILEVNQPENCANPEHPTGFGYFAHWVGVDNKADTRLVFWAWWHSGLRIVDYKDPANPKEIAYYNPPMKTDTVQPAEGHGMDASTPFIWYNESTCHIYAGFQDNGLMILELTDPEYNPCLRR